jgi:dimethylargininase
MPLALTRPVSPSLANCELTHLARQPIDIPRAIQQHAAYEQLLKSLGATVRQLPAAPDLPDAVFIEDTAVVLDEVAVIARPGAPSRRPETPAVAKVLAEYRPLCHIEPPATLDGGDVLRVGRTLYVGRSSRTSDEAIRQLRQLLEPLSNRVVPVEVTGCLHLKSAATLIADGLLLVNPAWLPNDAFPDLDHLAIDPAEPLAANALRIGDTVVYPGHFPRTLDRIRQHGLRVATIDCTELAKAEGAVTCCSLIVD